MPFHYPAKEKPTLGWHVFAGSREYILNGNWSDISERNVSQVKRLLIGRYDAFTTNLEFLKYFPKLESLRVHSDDVTDISAIYQLPKLRSLSLDAAPKAMKLDFRGLERLTELSLSYPKRIDSLERLSKLILIRLDHISGITDLDLSCHDRLKNVHLGPAQGIKTVSLCGLTRLRHLGLVLMPRLVSVKGTGYQTGLRTLDIRGTKSLPKSFFKPFKALDTVDVGTAGRYKPNDFPNCNPKILRWPV